MERTQFQKITEQYVSVWNSQDVERLIACYTDDLIYWDPGIRGEIKNKDAFRHYLKKLFENWQLEWSVREIYLLADRDGFVISWHGKFKKKGKEKTVGVDGIDLVLLRNNLIERSETYFDRSVVTSIL